VLQDPVQTLVGDRTAKILRSGLTASAAERGPGDELAEQIVQLGEAGRTGQRAAQIYLLEPEYVAPGFVPFYFSSSGRISRSQYWLRYFVPVLVIGMILSAMQLVAEGFQVLSGLFQLAAAWPGIALLVKRIHDRNKSGWLVWVLYGPMILAMLFSIAAFIAIALGSSEIASLGIISGVLWIAVLVVAIWFFVEFGCMRGTVGANQYGADPVAQG